MEKRNVITLVRFSLFPNVFGKKERKKHLPSPNNDPSKTDSYQPAKQIQRMKKVEKINNLWGLIFTTTRHSNH